MKKIHRERIDKFANIIFTILLVFLFFDNIHKIEKIMFVEHTLSFYEETKDSYNEGDGTIYNGVIYDTIAQIGKNGIDTIATTRRIVLSTSETDSLKNNKPKRENVGLLGDSTALINTIFSFFAFAGVIITLLYQILKDSKDKKQACNIQFEQQFFNMSSMLEDIVSHLEYVEKEKSNGLITDVNLLGEYAAKPLTPPKECPDVKEVKIIGRAVFRYLYYDRKNNLYEVLKNPALNDDSLQDSVKACLDGTLDHYFRFLYRILKHIDEIELLDGQENTDEIRLYYAHLLRAQLSCYELLLLYYNCLLKEHSKFKDLIEKYQMFNNLRVEELGEFDVEYNKALRDKMFLGDSHNLQKYSSYSIRAYWVESDLDDLKKEKVERNWSQLITNLKAFCKDTQNALSNYAQDKRTELTISIKSFKEAAILEGKQLLLSIWNILVWVWNNIENLVHKALSIVTKLKQQNSFYLCLFIIVFEAFAIFAFYAMALLIHLFLNRFF